MLGQWNSPDGGWPDPTLFGSKNDMGACQAVGVVQEGQPVRACIRRIQALVIALWLNDLVEHLHFCEYDRNTHGQLAHVKVFTHNVNSVGIEPMAEDARLWA